MVERISNVGRPTPLLGVSCEPARFDSSKQAVLLLNSGVMHHVGACRLTVKLARRFAQDAGVLSLRFDFSGVGDSALRRPTGSVQEVAVSEVVEVMDHLGETRGIDRFILYGLCSGAHNAFNTALADTRVEAIAQIDGYCFRTPKNYLRAYLPKLSSPAFWGRRIASPFASMIGRSAPRTSAEISGIASEYFEIADFGEAPTRQAISRGLQALVGRRVRLLCLFTGQQLEYNYADQYRDCFHEVEFGDHLSLHYLSDSNHIITDPKQQEKVVRIVSGWIREAS